MGETAQLPWGPHQSPEQRGCAGAGRLLWMEEFCFSFAFFMVGANKAYADVPENVPTGRKKLMVWTKGCEGRRLCRSWRERAIRDSELRN